MRVAKNGILDVAYVSPPFEPTKLLPLTICYYLPFSSSDPVLAAKSMMQLFEKFPALKDLAEKKYNQKFIGNTIMGSYELLTKFPVENIEQLKGRKIAGAGPQPCSGSRRWARCPCKALCPRPTLACRPACTTAGL